MARIKNHRNRNVGIIGKIKIGEKVDRKGKMIPQSLDYFRATSDNTFAINIFNKLYDKCSELPVCFVNDDDDFNTDHRFEIRTHQGKLFAYGDGQDFHVSTGEEMRLQTYESIMKKYGTVDSFMQKMEAYLSKDRYEAKFQEVLTLRFRIAQIPILGVWQLQTKAAKSSIDAILANYDQIKMLNGGTLDGVPFMLGVKKVVGNTAMKFNRSYPVLTLTPFMTEQAQNNSNIIESRNNTLLIDGK